MVRDERNAWINLVVSAITLTVYGILIANRLSTTPAERIDWLPLMAGAIGASIAASIALSIVWGAVAEAGSPRGVSARDDRDRDIAQMGDRVGQAFMVIGGLGAIALCALDAAPFWIAHTVFAGFALSAVVGGIARVIAYRRGLV